MPFSIKDLGAAKKILGMEIIRDRKKGELKLSQEKYIEKILDRFYMKDAKAVNSSSTNHFKLSSELCLETPEEKEYMARVSYSFAVGSLMYAMVCTRTNIAQVVGVVSRYMSNPGNIHWETMK